MAKCVYCKKDAGLFKKRHKECENLHQNNVEEINYLIKSAIRHPSEFKWLKNKIEKLAKEWVVSEQKLNEIYTYNYDKAVQKFLYDGVLTKDEEESLSLFQETLDVEQDVLNKNGAFQNFMKAVLIRDLALGKIPQVEFNVVGDLQLDFDKDEKIVWLFEWVELFEPAKKKHKMHSFGKADDDDEELGFYFRSVLFKWNYINPKKMKYNAIWIFIITNKSVYFDSNCVRVKVSIDEIRKLFSYEDWIWIQIKDMNIKPQVFRGLDGWFTYNIINNIQTNITKSL